MGGNGRGVCVLWSGGGVGGCAGLKSQILNQFFGLLTGATEAQYERAEQRGQQWPRPINIPAAFMSRLDPPLHSHLIKVTNINSCKP